MELKALDVLLSECGSEFPNLASEEKLELEKFREFLVRHGGLRKLEVPGRRAQLLDRADALRCFHFSQYLDWYLPEKARVSRAEVERARAVLSHLSRWLLQRGAISRETFEENLESIEAGELRDGEEQPEESGEEALPLKEEQDFYVPGEYSRLLSGEFTLTKVQEGILFGRLFGEGDEIGPILLERTVSSGHKVGDRVHLSLGKAGDHWNLLSEGFRRE